MSAGILQAAGTGSPTPARWDGRVSQATEWTGYVLNALQLHGQDLLRCQPRDIGQFCAAFPADGTRRARFWAFLISGIAEFESDFDPNQKYTESFTDQGKPVVSAGLLQLSVEDSGLYGCEFTNESDLVIPEKNLSCGVRILQRLIGQDNVISGNVGDRFFGAARYWSTMRPARQRHPLENIKHWCSSQTF